MIFIYSTFPTKTKAKEIGRKLVEKKLTACVNIFAIDSIYSFKKKVVRDKEFVAIIKTKKRNFRKIEKFILKNHPYTTPCILEIPIGRVTKKYRDWLNKEC